MISPVLLTNMPCAIYSFGDSKFLGTMTDPPTLNIGCERCSFSAQNS